MTEDQGKLGLVELAVEDVEIGAADAAGENLEADLPGTWGWRGKLTELEWGLRLG